MTLPVHIRDRKDADTNFILSSWLRTAEEDRRVDRDLYFVEHQRRIKEVLQREGVRVRVVADDDDDDHVFGWCCSEGDTLHYIFLKPSYRKQFGLARALLNDAFPDAPIAYHSNTGLNIDRLKLSSQFNPYKF